MNLLVTNPVAVSCSRSDVLGQFMPLVGKDWTQSGVAKLFSAIKVIPLVHFIRFENSYPIGYLRMALTL